VSSKHPPWTNCGRLVGPRAAPAQSCSCGKPALPSGADRTVGPDGPGVRREAAIASAALGERNSPDGSDGGSAVATAPARRLERTLDSPPRVLDSSGPRSPKPARTQPNPRVERRRCDPKQPHCHAVSGASTPRLRLPENRGVPSSILGLATLWFCLLIAGFCARRPAAVRSRWGRLSAFRVQLSVLNGPHSGVEAPTPGDKTATLLARAPERRSRAPGEVAGRSPTAWGCATSSGCGETTDVSREQDSRACDQGLPVASRAGRRYRGALR
jgi:hypothetical protein